MKKEIQLENLKQRNERHSERLEKLFNGGFDDNLAQGLVSVARDCFFLAIDAYYNENNIIKAKNYFNLQGILSLEGSKIHKSESFRRIFEVGRTLICNVGISDNATLIEQFANHNYTIRYNTRGKDIVTDFDTWVEKGQECIYNKLIINAISSDLDSLSQNLETFKRITLKKKMNQRMLLDLEFYEALLKKNHSRIKDVLNTFLSKKEHKYRNQHDMFPELISYPAVGYVKSCLLNGVDIDFEHQLIPRELLEITPNIKYTEWKMKN